MKWAQFLFSGTRERLRRGKAALRLSYHHWVDVSWSDKEDSRVCKESLHDTIAQLFFMTAAVRCCQLSRSLNNTPRGVAVVGIVNQEMVEPILRYPKPSDIINCRYDSFVSYLSAGGILWHTKGCGSCRFPLPKTEGTEHNCALSQRKSNWRASNTNSSLTNKQSHYSDKRSFILENMAL